MNEKLLALLIVVAVSFSIVFPIAASLTQQVHDDAARFHIEEQKMLQNRLIDP